MTVDVDGSVFTFKITTSAILESVYFKVENPEKVSIKATDDPVSTRVVTDSRLDYNLAFDFGVDSEGVSYSQYTLSLDGWDGAFLMSDEGFLSVAQFGNSIWAADCVRVPVPDAGSTLAFLGVSLLGLNQARRWWR
ncbi:MAG TPA: VPDSG-CTERM sorting domain-containing protein [Verrucomicrobiota bacterium]|nr:VPDSG-CTERM sorting domain-containing protein [Verrucomicrobiota bacterium]